MQVTRIYRNSAEYDLRIDSINMVRKQNTIASEASTHTFTRRLTTNNIYSTATSDRTVAEIEVIGDFDTIEGSSYAWAKWTSPQATVNMTDLPVVGDSV